MAIQNIDQIQPGTLVSYEDQANPRHIYTVVAVHNSRDWGVQYELEYADEGGTARSFSDLRQHGWNLAGPELLEQSTSPTCEHGAYADLCISCVPFVEIDEECAEIERLMAEEDYSADDAAEIVAEQKENGFQIGAKCESGWTGERCTLPLFHKGLHSDEIAEQEAMSRFDSIEGVRPHRIDQ